MIKKIILFICLRTGRFPLLLKFFGKPNGFEYASFLAKRNVFHHIGEYCSINDDTLFTDPGYVSIGDNVCLSSCTILGHDASVSVFMRSTGKILDKVGKVEIGSNVFIGYGSIVLPDVKIGSNIIVAAGSVVTKNLESGYIYAGVPAVNIGAIEKYISKIEEQTSKYPWFDILEGGDWHGKVEVERKLYQSRINHFYGH